MAIGERNRLITIQKPVEIQDPDSGELVVAYITYATEWAEIKTWKGKEEFSGTQQQSVIYTRIFIRSGLKVDEKMRVVYAKRIGDVPDIYNINYVIDDDNRKQELSCTKIAAEGLLKDGSNGQ